jgi:hypothetical protein
MCHKVPATVLLLHFLLIEVHVLCYQPLRYNYFHLAIIFKCDHQDFVTALEIDDSRSATYCPDIITISAGFYLRNNMPC